MTTVRRQTYPMRRLVLVGFALLLSCTAPPITVPSPSPSPSPSPTATAAPTATASPTAKSLDLTVAAAGEQRGDHALVLQIGDQPGSMVNTNRFWDVPLDGTAPKLLVSYTKVRSMLTDFDYFSFDRQLSPDGRRLVVSDQIDVAGTGLLVVDLIAGTVRTIDAGGGVNTPAWSPDGQRIAYSGFDVAGPFQKETGIWTVSATGGLPRRVWASDRAAGTGATFILGWTEDGLGIAIAGASPEAAVVDIATGTLRSLGGMVQGIAWRARRPSTAIVFDDQQRLPLAPMVGRVEVRDTTIGLPRVVARYGPGEGTFLLGPSWNPRSDEILLLWGAGQGVRARDELVVVDGVTASRRVLPTTGTPRSAAWSGDGAQILYTDFTAVRLMRGDGSKPADHELFRPGLPPGTFQQFVAAVAAFAPRGGATTR